MKVTIICFVGDYAICKNQDGYIFNVLKEKVDDFNIGDIIDMTEDGEIVEKEEEEEKYYVCDDVVIFYND
ncbi:hypothetical protein HBE96_00600 [Clostridium sp. P21]|uniref:Uncharacterized protein n=1 Tax=Clostridium muellerianum TaxID=2716538 RepID=A0A7Y0ED24_9CLOT|nr:hypothetical protein [Clostridium muellerianum]NMM61223.1 hypothetical protein [Clostridium muellerianum]